MAAGSIWLALRTLWRSPRFALSAIATLAVGSLSTLLLFAFTEAVVLRPLPFDRPESIAVLDSERAGNDAVKGLSGADCRDIEETTNAFSGIGIIGSLELVVSTTEGAQRIQAGEMSEGVIPLLGAHLRLGRGIPAGDNRGSAVLSYGYWLTQYGGDPGAIGKTIRYNGNRAATIVGVLGPAFNCSPADENGAGLLFGDPPDWRCRYSREHDVDRTRPLAHDGEHRPGTAATEGFWCQATGLVSEKLSKCGLSFAASGGCNQRFMAPRLFLSECHGFPRHGRFRREYRDPVPDSGALSTARNGPAGRARCQSGRPRRPAAGGVDDRLDSRVLSGLALAWAVTRMVASGALAPLHIPRLAEAAVGGPVVLYALLLIIGISPSARLHPRGLSFARPRGP